jgi:hypothetical protein
VAEPVVVRVAQGGGGGGEDQRPIIELEFRYLKGFVTGGRRGGQGRRRTSVGWQCGEAVGRRLDRGWHAGGGRGRRGGVLVGRRRRGRVTRGRQAKEVASE